MHKDFYKNLLDTSISNKLLERMIYKNILESSDIELLHLIDTAFILRKKYYGKEVLVHILNNVQNGRCTEDCSYCAQSRESTTPIEEYSMKSDEEILKEAEDAHKKGAFRYCMVFSGKGPSNKRIEHLAKIVREIKARYPIEVCVSPGTIDDNMAKTLKEAGLNRLNHNLNTSKELYPKICSTHTFEDRLNTLHSAKRQNLQICSGVIIGMGETADDIIDMALTLREVNADSIPVNFFIPIDGVKLKDSMKLTPEFCLRVLCLFRFINPKADIRIAAGRELHLRSLEPLSFYIANSFFLNGYLNVKGEHTSKILQMLKDMEFQIKSEYSLDNLLTNDMNNNIKLKQKSDLRPSLNS